MRNEWYPHKKAEYMTTTRFRELGLSRGEIGERDAGFGVSSDEDFEDVPESVVPTPAVALTTSVCVATTICHGPCSFALPSSAFASLILTIRNQQPERAHSILTTLIPPVLTFHRKPIPAPAPMPAPAAISPLVAHANPGTATAPDVPVAIYGSVSVTDIVGYIKGALAEDAAGSRIVLAPGDILFVGLAKETDRLKELGRWEVDISVGAPGLEPVRKVVEVIASVEASVEGEPQPAL